MSVFHRLAALALAAALLAPRCAHASDDSDDDGVDRAAFSSAPTLLQICGGENAPLNAEACKDGSFARRAKHLDSSLQAALAKLPANIRPLLKRDQYWFGETILNATGTSIPREVGPANLEAIAGMLSRRIATLEQIALGFGRDGVLGKWEDAFGSVTVTAADGGAYRLAINTDSGFGTNNGYPWDEHHRWRCQATALVKQRQDGWLAGTLVVERKPDPAGRDDADAPPLKPLPIKMRRQGETLRVVTAYQDPDYNDVPPICAIAEQITATYFASGKSDAAAAADKTATGFVAPTFDCARPLTASDEEICADPDMADNDQRLNRAWKALLPRLDEATRRALIDDQRRWVRQQAGQFPLSLHPGGDKTSYDQHHTLLARDDLNELQRTRIALLEGFDEHRKGLAGVWLNYTASLNVTETPDGGLKAAGWKWDQSDWKHICEYDMEGKVVDGAFRSNVQRKNPDTLERDHTLLIVNRLDDVFAAKREDPVESDEPKCTRRYSNSSTVRLFPAKASPDINNFGLLRTRQSAQQF